MIPATLIFAGIISTGVSIFQMGETGPSLQKLSAGMLGVCLIAIGASVLAGSA